MAAILLWVCCVSACLQLGMNYSLASSPQAPTWHIPVGSTFPFSHVGIFLWLWWLMVAKDKMGVGYRHEVFKGSHSGGPSELCRVTMVNPEARPCVSSLSFSTGVTGF